MSHALLRGRRAARVALAAAAALTGVAALGAPTAGAEVGAPPQYPRPAVALESQFLVQPRIPPAAPSAVCLVDSGVDEAAADLAPGQLLHAEALDGGTPSDTFTDKHGTLMARMMGAQLNGTGMVGIWPAVGIVSVRATKGDEQSFRYAAFSTAITRCIELRADGYPITVISLSLGGATDPAPDEAAQVRDAIARARQSGLVVVAAGGNSPGLVASPAREPGVVAALASDPTGVPCSFSPTRDEGAALYVPGCDLDAVTPTGERVAGAGTSQATAMLATVVAAARAYRPELGVADIEQSITNSAHLSAERLFSALGIDSAQSGGVQPGTVTTDGAVATPVALRSESVLKPVLRSLRRRGDIVSLRLAPGPRLAWLSLSVRGRKPGTPRVATLRRHTFPAGTSTVRFRLPRRATFIVLRFVRPGVRTAPLTVRVPRAGARG